jgi:hypothetical protein
MQSVNLRLCSQPDCQGPGEDFSGLLNRWRQVEVMLGEDYFWLLPWKYRQIMSDKGEYHYPLFVSLGYTPERIKMGLSGASLPFVSVDVPELDSLHLEPQESAIAEIDPSRLTRSQLQSSYLQLFKRRSLRMKCS